MTMLADYKLILSEVFVLLSTFISILFGLGKQEKFVKFFSIFSILCTIIILFIQISPQPILIFNNLLKLDIYTYCAKLLILTIALLVLIMFTCTKHEYSYEFPTVILFAVLGMMALISANDLISFYLSFEIQSISSYVLCAFNRRSKESSEAGIKYFVLGALSSCIMIYGISMIYGYSGHTHFIAIANFLQNNSSIPAGLVLGLVLMLVSIFFKLSIAPFHMWTPDVYQGTPTIVTVFFATLPKATFIMVLIRLLNEVFITLLSDWQQILICAAVLSIFVSALGAMRQHNLKRLLAYGTIGHMGYILMSISTGLSSGMQGALIYLLLYMTMSVGVFAYLLQLDIHCDITKLSGLHSKSPMAAFSLSVLLLSMAGIPPLAGFFGKFYILSALIAGKFIVLSVIFIIANVIAAFYYLRIIKVMYFDSPITDDVTLNSSKFLNIITVIMMLINLTFCLFYSYTKNIIEYFFYFYFFK